MKYLRGGGGKILILQLDEKASIMYLAIRGRASGSKWRIKLSGETSDVSLPLPVSTSVEKTEMPCSYSLS